LKGISRQKNGNAPPSGEKPSAHLQVAYEVSERRACSAVGTDIAHPVRYRAAVARTIRQCGLGYVKLASVSPDGLGLSAGLHILLKGAKGHRHEPIRSSQPPLPVKNGFQVGRVGGPILECC